MKILVLNSGSSSLKFQLIETGPEQIDNNMDHLLAGGSIEKIGTSEAIVTYRVPGRPDSKFIAEILEHQHAVARREQVEHGRDRAHARREREPVGGAWVLALGVQDGRPVAGTIAAGDGSFRLDMDYFAFQHSAYESFTPRFADLFGRPRTKEESNLLDPHYAEWQATGGGEPLPRWLEQRKARNATIDAGFRAPPIARPPRAARR